MAKGGFKVLINGRVERCHRFVVDYDQRLFWKDIQKQSPDDIDLKGEDFNPKTFAVMTVTREDME